jgi:hypothetical protein
MNGRMLRTAAGAGVLAIGAVLFFASLAAAQGPAVSASDASGAVGDEVTVDLSALDIEAPGLGAWSIDVTWDSAVVSLTACGTVADVGNQVCNPEFDDETARAAGATATGLEGDSDLLELTFECLDEGTSVIGIRLVTFADATVGGPEPIAAEVDNGSVTCAAEAGGLPDTGTGAGGGGPSLVWLVAVLAAAGAVTLTVGYRTRRA